MRARLGIGPEWWHAAVGKGGQVQEEGQIGAMLPYPMFFAPMPLRPAFSRVKKKGTSRLKAEPTAGVVLSYVAGGSKSQRKDNE